MENKTSCSAKHSKATSLLLHDRFLKAAAELTNLQICIRLNLGWHSKILLHLERLLSEDFVHCLRNFLCQANQYAKRLGIRFDHILLDHRYTKNGAAWAGREFRGYW